MLRVGLTGGIGAGKSAVSARLAAAGAQVVDADLLSREVVAPGTPGLAAVVAAFGEEVLRDDGSLDRPRLGSLVFGDDAARARLNAIVHPLVAARTAERLRAAPPDAVVVHDVPLLVENGLAPGYHLVVVVEAPAGVRRARLAATRGMAAEEAAARMAAQATDPERQAVADVVLRNDGPLAALHDAVDALWTARLAPYAANLAAGTAAPEPSAVVPWDPRWADQARRALARLRAAFGERAALAHVGPTAEPGTAAVDVLDLRATAAPGTDVAALVAALPGTGWIAPDGPGPTRAADPGRPARLHLAGA